MDKVLNNTGAIVSGIFGAIITPVFEYFYGSGEFVKSLMTALFFFIAMDWISGVRAAKKDETYASVYGIDGIFRTFFILALPAGGHLLDKIVGAPSIAFGMLGFGVLYHVLQSMTANAIRAGWTTHVPEAILTWLINWVKSELEAKMARAEKRKNEKQMIKE